MLSLADLDRTEYSTIAAACSGIQNDVTPEGLRITSMFAGPGVH